MQGTKVRGFGFSSHGGGGNSLLLDFPLFSHDSVESIVFFCRTSLLVVINRTYLTIEDKDTAYKLMRRVFEIIRNGF